MFILLNFSILLLLAMFFFLTLRKNKHQIDYAFMALIGSLFIWSIGYLILEYSYIFFKYRNEYLYYFTFLGICMTPVSAFLVGYIFAHTRINFNWIFKSLFIIPIISLVTVFTNNYHHLFFIQVKYELQDVYGLYFWIHTIYSYALIIIGMFYLTFFSIKNSGFFSKQSIIIIIGFSIPLIVNILITVQLVKMPYYTDVISFSFAIICFSIAIFKFKFLNITPIALQRIVDLISDSYIVINKDTEIIDYNKTFVDTFKGVLNINRKDNLVSLLNNSTNIDIDKDKIFDLNKKAIVASKTLVFEKLITAGDFNKHFNIEITPIFSQGKNYIGTILLFKDITQAKRDIEIIKEKQSILIEQERLASLGQLIGGIAHNLKTPIMSIAGGLEGIRQLAKEYDESISDSGVTIDDHHEIADEMIQWVEKLKPYCSYMSDVIDAVKGQAVQTSSSSFRTFTLNELVKRIELLMSHELKMSHINLKFDISIDENTEIKGDLNSIVQIFDNLIINAIHAYEHNSGDIDFIVKKADNYIEFIIRDYGNGISQEVKERLFKEMITTKGKDGTGLGLYMTYANIRGRFGGDIRFESEVGNGTSFFIKLPCPDETTQEDAS